MLIERGKEYSQLISFLQNELFEMQDAALDVQETDQKDFPLTENGRFTLALRGLIMDLMEHNVADTQINQVIQDCMRAFNVSMQAEDSLPSLRTIGRIGAEAQCLAHVQVARTIVDQRNSGPMGISHDGSQLAQQKLITNGLHCKHDRLQLDVVPIFNNTAEGQMDGLMFSLDMMSKTTLALDPATAALGATTAQVLQRLQIALNDKASTETAFNKKIASVKAELQTALSQSPLTADQKAALELVGTFCFQHHNGGCAASIRKTVRVLMRAITSKVARPFDDRAIEPDEVEEYKKAAEDTAAVELGIDPNIFPAPKYPDTAFDGIRIFNKLLSSKSDYGFAVADKAKATMDQDAWGVIEQLQRVVGTRETEYLRSSGPILRIRRVASKWLTEFLATYKQGAQNTSATLNKLETAVLDFLDDDFSAIQLCANTALDKALFRPNFSTLKGLPLTCPLDPSENQKIESAKPMNQAQMVWYAKVLNSLYNECETDPHLVLTGMAASRLTGRYGWKNTSDLVTSILLYCTVQFLTPPGHELAIRTLRTPEAEQPEHQDTDLRAVQIAVASSCSSLKSNSKEVSHFQFSQILLYGARRPDDFSLGTKVRLTHVAAVTRLAMGGVVSCFAGRAEDFLPGGRLTAPDKPTLKLLAMMSSDSDFSERAFAINDARTKRSRSASASTKSRYTMTVVNQTGKWRRGLEDNDRAQLMSTAISQARSIQRDIKARSAEMKEKKKKYLWEIHEQGVKKARALKQKTVMLLSVPLCTLPTVAKEVFRLLKGKGKRKKWLTVQFQVWKLRIPALTSKGGLLQRGAFKNLNEEKLLGLFTEFSQPSQSPSQEESEAEIVVQLKQQQEEAKAQIEQQLDTPDIDEDDVQVYWYRCERKKGSGRCDKWRLLEVEYDQSDGKFMCSRVGQSCADECDACELVQCVCEE